MDKDRDREELGLVKERERETNSGPAESDVVPGVSMSTYQTTVWLLVWMAK